MVSTSSNRGCGIVAARPLCMRKVRGSTPRISSNLRMVTCSIHVGCFQRTYSSEVEISIADSFSFLHIPWHDCLPTSTTKWKTSALSTHTLVFDCWTYCLATLLTLHATCLSHYYWVHSFHFSANINITITMHSHTLLWNGISVPVL